MSGCPHNPSLAPSLGGAARRGGASQNLNATATLAVWANLEDMNNGDIKCVVRSEINLLCQTSQWVVVTLSVKAASLSLSLSPGQPSGQCGGRECVNQSVNCDADHPRIKVDTRVSERQGDIYRLPAAAFGRLWKLIKRMVINGKRIYKVVCYLLICIVICIVVVRPL